MKTRNKLHWLVGLWLLLFAAACTTPTPTTSNETPLLPTQMTLAPVETTALPTPTLEPTATLPPTPEPEPTAPLLDDAAAFQVVYVAADDVLNVRSGPGVGNDIVGELAPDTTNITITGEGQMVEGSLWVPVQAGTVAGWVNSTYLAETVAGTDFCQDAAAQQLILDLKAAIDARDGTALAALVHPERGLTIHRHWWNPAVNIPAEAMPNVFAETSSYYWGTEDGSGFDINGSFSEVALPLLDNDLVAGSEVACNEILAGNTAGLVRLPDGYDQLNYLSVYRPAVDIEFDWGSWVVGVEKVEGRYVVSYLVHFAWEI